MQFHSILRSCSEDLGYLPVLASLPPQQSVFEYLVGCWKRLNIARSAVMKKVGSWPFRGFQKLILRQSYIPSDGLKALEHLDKVRQLIISYSGYILQEPEMFPQPPGYVPHHTFFFSSH